MFSVPFSLSCSYPLCYFCFIFLSFLPLLSCFNYCYSFSYRLPPCFCMFFLIFSLQLSTFSNPVPFQLFSLNNFLLPLFLCYFFSFLCLCRSLCCFEVTGRYPISWVIDLRGFLHHNPGILGIRHFILFGIYCLRTVKSSLGSNAQFGFHVLRILGSVECTAGNQNPSEICLL